MLPFFPLEYGLLTGKYRRGERRPGRLAGRRSTRRRAELAGDAADWDRIEAVEKYAAARDLGVLDVAIAGPGGPARRRVGDLRRDVGRPGARQRGGAALAAHAEADLVELDEITP